MNRDPITGEPRCGWQARSDDSPCGKPPGHKDPHRVHSPYGDGRWTEHDVTTGEEIGRGGPWSPHARSVGDLRYDRGDEIPSHIWDGESWLPVPRPETRTLWAIRYPNGDLSGAMTGDNAEHVVRVAAGGSEEIVICVETIYRTPWVTAPPYRCCDLHGRNCEPPSELCCEACTEARHPSHPPGTVCSNPDLSGNGEERQARRV